LVELLPGARFPGALDVLVEPDLVVPAVLEVFVVFVLVGFIFYIILSFTRVSYLV
jgi:hypothetical protein